MTLRFFLNCFNMCIMTLRFFLLLFVHFVHSLPVLCFICRIPFIMKSKLIPAICFHFFHIHLLHCQSVFLLQLFLIRHSSCQFAPPSHICHAHSLSLTQPV